MVDLAWSPDGRTIYAGSSRSEIVAVDISGERAVARKIAPVELPGLAEFAAEHGLKPIFVESICNDEAMIEATARLLTCLRDPLDSKVLGGPAPPPDAARGP